MKHARSSRFSDICDDLKGKYPKDFKFIGWHPWCRCYAVPILPSPDEFADFDMDTNHHEGEITDVPQGFKDWVGRNESRIANAKSMPSFLKDNTKYTGIKPSYGSAGAMAGTKLGRAATREAYKAYEDSEPPTLTKEQEENIREIARSMGIKGDIKPMTFFDADNGKGNVHFKAGTVYEENCQSCVAVHEARLRGLDITAKGYSDEKDSASFLLGEHFEAVWRNPKTGKTPQPTILRGKDVLDKLDKLTKTTGRYHVGINRLDGTGHVVTAERMMDGRMIFYDPQRNVFLNMKEVEDIGSLEVIRIDKMLLDVTMLPAVSEVI